MLKQVRHAVITSLWHQYRETSFQMQQIETCLKQKGVSAALPLDHFAVIDLPGPHTGIQHLSEIFSYLGYQTRGQDYLADKQNDFLWMAEEDSENQIASSVLPQVVVADFRPQELPSTVRNIIEKYANLAPPPPKDKIQTLIKQAKNGDKTAEKHLIPLLLDYFSGRDWPLPTVNEFRTVQECNELLAWVLIFGRKPNHFTLSIHLLSHFADLPAFHQLIEQDLGLTLNRDGGIIKGGEAKGIAQSSTLGEAQQVKLKDAEITIPGDFVEFVWRYPHSSCHKPVLWKDFFTGFVAQHADHVIESLYM